jgi:NADH-quinone oxidoreductase subunit E
MMTPEREPVTLPILREFAAASRDTLIPILQRVQEVEGYLSERTIAEIGRYLQLPSSKIYGVATFYNQFRFAPKGKFHLMLCRGTACHVKGSVKLVEAVARLLKLRPGQTSRDGVFSLEVVACMGACGLAPAIAVNGEMHAKVNPARLERLIAACRAEEQEA